MPALEYIAKANANEGEREYWLMDESRCVGRVRLYREPKGRKRVSAHNIDLEFEDTTLDQLIKLAVGKARKLGIDPVLMSCDATDYVRRESIERSGGELVDVARERVPTHSGKVRVYSFSAPLLPPSFQGVLRDAGKLGEDLAGSAKSEPLPGSAV